MSKGDSVQLYAPEMVPPKVSAGRSLKAGVG